MKLQIFYDKQPKKFLKKLDKHQIKRILDKIDILSTNPVPHDSKSIVNQHNVFRIRLGDIRVLYRLNYEEKKIVFNIDNREKAYS
ncbi:MAG: type II toxin-antitoxin system RelE family toxin [Nanoarchaeota archaeon]